MAGKGGAGTTGRRPLFSCLPDVAGCGMLYEVIR